LGYGSADKRITLGLALNKRIIVFAPHPDDETLGCGGTIIKRITEGYEAIVVVMTDGRHALSNAFGIQNNPSPEEMKQIRAAETVTAMQILGVTKKNIIFLDFEDGKLTENCKQLMVKVTEILKEFQPVEVYFPQKKDCHPDHKTAGIVLEAAIRKLNFPMKGYQYSIGMKYLHLGPIKAKFLDYFRNNHVYVDISPFLTKKAAAINAHRSQVTTVCANQERPVIQTPSRFLNKHEVFLQFNPTQSDR
jgi:LmbE family N-acetylglucosaminyl deacetylase